jgi:predicted DNA-binding protein (UPF0251 family)
MEKNMKIKVIAGAVAALALAVAVGAAGAVAASRALSPDEESQAVIDDAASELGVEPDALSDALKQGLKNRVDEAVESGRLTEEQGAELKERIDSGEAPLLVGGLGPRGAFGHGPHGHLGGLDAAATYLGLTEAELREQLEDGKSLAEVAKAEGKTVDGLVAAMVEAAEKKIDEAVANGRITEERAADLKQGLEERITDLVSSEPRQLRFEGRPGGFGFGPGGFHGGAPGFRGPRA